MFVLVISCSKDQMRQKDAAVFKAKPQLSLKEEVAMERDDVL